MTDCQTVNHWTASCVINRPKKHISPIFQYPQKPEHRIFQSKRFSFRSTDCRFHRLLFSVSEQMRWASTSCWIRPESRWEALLRIVWDQLPLLKFASDKENSSTNLLAFSIVPYATWAFINTSTSNWQNLKHHTKALPLSSSSWEFTIETNYVLYHAFTHDTVQNTTKTKNNMNELSSCSLGRSI